MSTVLRKPNVFDAARELRRYAEEHNLPQKKLLAGCVAANKELANGRTVAVAVTQGLKVMRA